MANSYLVNVRVPHFGEKSESWRGVGIVNRELDTCLGEKRKTKQFTNHNSNSLCRFSVLNLIKSDFMLNPNKEIGLIV